MKPGRGPKGMAMSLKYWRFQVRAFLTRIGLWGPFERLRLRWRFRRGIAHEPEFLIFRHFDGTDQLFVDVGANLGQSALSFRLANRTAPIVSFEPNPDMAPALQVVKGLLGESFEYRLVGLGARTEVKTLYVPIVKGVPFPQCATFLRECLEDNPNIQQLLFDWTHTRQFEIAEHKLQIVRFDELGLRPGFIKIDAEGGERDVVAGMTETLARCRPLIMTEGFGAQAALADLGYVPLLYEADGNFLRPVLPGESASNVFFAPQEKLAELQRAGAVRLSLESAERRAA
ncbi:MAG: FkbM family methyltransferase [Planctomycetes bacterium]|nr:FkbM family methyltransferase [Planctomycetota bacterium]